VKSFAFNVCYIFFSPPPIHNAVVLSLNINGATPLLPLCAFMVLTKTLPFICVIITVTSFCFLKVQVICQVKNVHPPYKVFILGHVT